MPERFRRGRKHRKDARDSPPEQLQQKRLQGPLPQHHPTTGRLLAHRLSSFVKQQRADVGWRLSVKVSKKVQMGSDETRIGRSETMVS